VCWSDWRDGKVIPAQLVGTAALRDFNPFYDRLGVKMRKPHPSKCFPIFPRKPTLLGAVGTAEKCQ